MVKTGQSDQKRFKHIQRKYTPPRPIVRNGTLAFLVGGAICSVGEVVRQGFFRLGLGPDLAAGPTVAVIIFLGALLTGLGVYDRIGRVGGMGAMLPVSGFANAIVAPAMEYKREGWILGVGARMFTVAGPVLVYGLITSFAIGLLYYLLYAPR